jgi:hypothetical protein
MEGRRFYAKPALSARPDAAVFYRRQRENSEIHSRRNCSILRNEAYVKRKREEDRRGLFLFRAYQVTSHQSDMRKNFDEPVACLFVVLLRAHLLKANRDEGD